MTTDSELLENNKEIIEEIEKRISANRRFEAGTEAKKLFLLAVKNPKPTTCKGCIFLDKHKKIDISARGWWCDKYNFNFYHPNMICLSRVTEGSLCDYCKLQHKCHFCKSSS